jgi:hypothetical protein
MKNMKNQFIILKGLMILEKYIPMWIYEGADVNIKDQMLTYRIIMDGHH